MGIKQFLKALALSAILIGPVQSAVYLTDDFEWTPSLSDWPYKNTGAGSSHTCTHNSNEHGWDNELFDVCVSTNCSTDPATTAIACDWHENGISTAQHKSGTRSFLNKSYGAQRESGDLSRTFTATPTGQTVWTNFWVMFDTGWASLSPATSEPYMHFFLLNTGQSVSGPRMNLQTFAPYWSSGGQHYCGPGGTQGLPSTTKYLFMVPQTDSHDWGLGTTPSATMFPNGCYNLMDHLGQWLWFSIKWQPAASVGGNGSIEIWINDVLYYTSTEIWSSNDTGCTNAFCKIILSNFRSTLGGSGAFDQGIFYDDLSITDTRLSAPGSSLLASPTNVHRNP